MRGRGIFIMRSYMDEVSFEKRGTEVHLRKDPAVARVDSSRPRSHILPFGSQPLAASGSGELLHRSIRSLDQGPRFGKVVWVTRRGGRLLDERPVHTTLDVAMASVLIFVFRAVTT